MKTFIFKTQFFHDKRIRREIEIMGNVSLYELAKTIVCAYDFDFDHPFGFFSKIPTDGMASRTRVAMGSSPILTLRKRMAQKA